jgi:hypothetical protein
MIGNYVVRGRSAGWSGSFALREQIYEYRWGHLEEWLSEDLDLRNTGLAVLGEGEGSGGPR